MTISPPGSAQGIVTCWHNRLDQLPQTLLAPMCLQGRRVEQEGKRADIQQGSEATWSSTRSRIYGGNQTMSACRIPLHAGMGPYMGETWGAP